MSLLRVRKRQTAKTGLNCALTLVIKFVRPLIKYPVTFFIFLLIGYSQLFAPLYRGNTLDSPAKKITESIQGHVLGIKTEDAQTVFIAEEEEENERVSMKTHADDAPTLSYAQLQEYFFQHTKAGALFVAHVSRSSFLKAPYLLFRVFRL